MEKKGTIISLIVIGIIITCAVTFIILSGIIMQEYNYVQIEVNPRAEFICDNKYKVVSVNPLNDDARVVLADLTFTDMQIEDAVVLFLDECAKCGFIDVDGVSNATNITVIDGITQALDVHITQKVYDYYRTKEIMRSITESYEVRQIFDNKKKEKIACSNKYKLISTMAEIDDSESISTLKKLSEVELVDKVLARHNAQPYTPLDDEKLAKQQLLKSNRSKYRQHMDSISNHSQKEFSQLFSDFQKYSSKEYQTDFDKEYTIWQERYR